MREDTVKRHPLFNNEPTIDEIEGLESLFTGEFANMGELTESQKSDKFMSDYIEKNDPVGVFKSYFESSAKTVDHILKEIKNFHKRLVLQGSWSEEKYISVINGILENNIVLSVATIDRGGLFYDRDNSPRVKSPQNNTSKTTNGKTTRLTSSNRKTTLSKTSDSPKGRITSLRKK